MMTSKEIRQSFLDFMASKGHQVVPSAPMVIKDDPTLMFTNAGMNPWKGIILGNDPIKYPRVADSQKCLRVSGKHNDLEEVGHDTYHHTMFEMLGNWSFGDYFKQEAIDYAWEYIVDVLKIDPSNLYATVFEGSPEEGLSRDDEAASIWLKHLPADHILNGNKHDNFWEMGETGPCGPCSEIHVDSRSEEEKAQVPGRELVNKDHPQVIEIWNIVFMQFNRKADGSLEPLAKKVIDTGMGFERLVRTIQGKTSNYDTDVFQPMLKKIGEICQCQYGADEKTDVAMRVIADHIRTIAFAITDGQLPSNEKAGYVIRRILRRAVRYGYTFLNMREAFLYKLVPQLIADMGEAYPELAKQQAQIVPVIKSEEEAFLRTLDKGIGLLDKLMDEARKAGKKEISGVDVFTLKDTYGFPLDLTELILRENGFTTNEEEYNKALEHQKSMGREANKQDLGDWTVLAEGETEFVGYDQLACVTRILRYRKVSQKGKEFYQVVLSKTPFYAEMGGEIGDTGCLKLQGDNVQCTKEFKVVDTKRENGLPVHIMTELPEKLRMENGEWRIVASVDAEKRQAIMCNHTATHILHYALRQVLGNHVEQKGSLVTADSLRFDFCHFQKVTPEELREVEKAANRLIRQDLPLEESRHTPIAEAKAMGAMALFGEKYGDDVRVIKYGPSIELCGGCHVPSTGKIGSVRIIMETSVAAGVRRIEAVTAAKADELYYAQQDMLVNLRQLFNNAPDLAGAIHRSIEENAGLKKQIEEFMAEKIERFRDELISRAENLGDIKLVRLQGEVAPDMIRGVMPMLRGKFTDVKFAVVGATQYEGKPTIAVFLSQPLVDAGKNAGAMIKSAAKLIQGGGGGQPWMATAGGRDVNGLDAAMEQLLRDLE
ncbi:MAG: alanine--tRNA ligase [Paludibacteraceae bacterium]|nr:alanine--tRNA ligase [Paludibacteraceae bacterium]MBR0064469.1 alanine--tRNA ligase [Paludibacteraceae bacterium]